MAQNYYWSAENVSFYPAAVKNIYTKAGTFPSDAVLVDDTVFQSYGLTEAPTGKTRGVGSDNMPTWIDDPASASTE